MVKPNLRKMDGLLDALVSRSQDRWQHTHFCLAAIGERIAIDGSGHLRKPLEAGRADQIRPFIAAARMRAAPGEHSVLGHCYVGHLMLHPEENCQLQRMGTASQSSSTADRVRACR